MADYAHIESLDALKRFRAALVKFVDGVSIGLDEAEAEVQRTDMWLKQEQPPYWKHQVAIRAEFVARAKSALKRKQLQTTGMNNRPSCVDELKELARAERVLEEAQHKQEEVRRWSRLFEQESFTYTATAQRLRTASQSGLPLALAQLDAMIAAIEAYGASPERQWQGSTIGSSLDKAGDPTNAARGARGATAALFDYQRLRALTPPAELRNQILLQSAGEIAVVSCETTNATATGPNAGQSPIRTLLQATRTPAMPGDKVTLAPGVGKQPRLYMERTRAGTPGDSGWHIGSTDGAQPGSPRFAAVNVHELLHKSTFLAQFLEFPPGWLIVVNNGSLEAVLDPVNALRWYRGERPPEAAAQAQAGDDIGGGAAPESRAE